MLDWLYFFPQSWMVSYPKMGINTWARDLAILASSGKKAGV
jgi:hypothetical protein